jgi:hypothetical protein
MTKRRKRRKRRKRGRGGGGGGGGKGRGRGGREKEEEPGATTYPWRVWSMGDERRATSWREMKSMRMWGLCFIQQR